MTPQARILAIAGVGLIALTFHNVFYYLYFNWQREEYSHGFLIPLISALLIWQRYPQIKATPFTASWSGVAVTAFGILVSIVGALAAITSIDAYAFVIVLAGFALSFMGWAAFKLVRLPVALLLLSNPLPAFLFNKLSSSLQLLSSQIGVFVIGLFGISVNLEGNVIDLGSYQLQVAEACSGLRYLFPLLTLGILVAAIIRCRLWMKLVITLSTAPITVLMNSFRIGVIGILVDRYGIAQAEGFLHQFEGWIIFIACLLLLALEIVVLLRLTGDRRGLRDVLVFQWPEKAPKDVTSLARAAPVSALAAMVLVATAAYPILVLADRPEVIPDRADLTRFPMQIGDWQGRRGRIENEYLDYLKLDDYVLADFATSGETPVNFYIAYYLSQRTGQSVHSPASCLPGGGWTMSDFHPYAVPGAVLGGKALTVNHVLIEQGRERQLVYYWFQQRGHIVTNEYRVKWLLLWDSLERRRTDGALVRIMTPLKSNETVENAESRLNRFARQAVPLIGPFVPD